MADQAYSADDMMTALARADAAGNHADAAAIAQHIQATYPDHVAAALAAVPPVPMPGQGGRPGFAGAPSISNLPPAASVSPAQPLPQVNTSLQNTPDPSAVAPGAQGGAPLQATAAHLPGNDAGQGGSNWLQNIGQSLVDFSRSTVAAIPGGTQVASAVNAFVNGVPYSQGAQNVAQIQQQAQQNSPIASTLGSIYGNTATMVGGGALASGAAGLAARSGIPLISQIGAGSQAIANTLGNIGGAGGALIRGAGAGAIGGGIDAVAHGSSATDTAAEVGLGAIGGAAVGGAARLVETKLAPAAQRAWAALSDKLTDMAKDGALDSVLGQQAAQRLAEIGKIDPDALAATHAGMTAANGGQPVPLVAAFQQYAQAAMRDVSGSNAEVGNAMRAASNDYEAAGPKAVPSLIDDAVGPVPHASSPTGQAGVQTLGSLERARDTWADQNYGAVRGNMVEITPDDEDALTHQSVRSVLRSNPNMRREVYDALGQATDPDGDGTGAISINTLDKIRSALSDRMASANAAPIREAAATGHAGITQIASADPAYAAVLAQDTQHRAFTDGFQAGQSGQPIDAISGATRKAANATTGDAFTAGHASGLISGLASNASQSESSAQSVLQRLAQDNQLRDTLEEAYGPATTDKLATVGSRLSQATAAIRASTPSAPVGAAAGASGDATNSFGHAAIGAATGNHHATIYNLVRGIFSSLGHGGGLNDAIAAKVTDMAANPASAGQAINFMRANGAREEQLAPIRAYIAAIGGGRFAHSVNSQVQ